MPNLLVCLDPGVGLKMLQKIGILYREMKPYVEYAKRGWKVKIVAYGNNNVELPDGIEVISLPHGRLVYLFFLLGYKHGKWADIIRTNQTHLSWHYVFAALIWRKPILLRCGYVHGEYVERTKGKGLLTALYLFLERIAFVFATGCSVPTENLAGWVEKKYVLKKGHVNIVPNFVDVSVFKPEAGAIRDELSFVSVGRLDPVKRYDMLIDACSMIPGSRLTIVGDGDLKEFLKDYAIKKNVLLSLPGNIANDKLPETLNRHSFFIITSFIEGHPKALLEAMACGLRCIGVRVKGISNVISHNVNGLLAEPDPESIKSAVQTLLNDKDTANRISKNAISYIEKAFSLNEVFSKEYAVISKCLTQYANNK